MKKLLESPKQTRTVLLIVTSIVLISLPLAVVRSWFESEPEQRGIVIEELEPGSALEAAGIDVSDILTAWERRPNPPANPESARGELKSVWDWYWMVEEETDRGIVKVVGERRGERVEFEVQLGLWGAQVRPRMPTYMEKSYLKGRVLLKDKNVFEASRSWREVAEAAAEQDRPALRCWILLRTGKAWADARNWEKAHAAFHEALAGARDPKWSIAIRQAVAKTYERQNELDKANNTYLKLLDLMGVRWGESLHAAAIIESTGRVALHLGNLATAIDRLRQALEIRERQAPQSLALASSLTALGVAEGHRERLEEAENLHGRALQIQEKLAPGSLEVARTVNSLGIVKFKRGDLASSADYFSRSLKIRESLETTSLAVADSLNNLGVLARNRGQLDEAADLHRRAYKIRQELAPGSRSLATSLVNLGLVAKTRGELDVANEYLHRALEIQEKVAPQSAITAAALNNLGTVALHRRALDQAIAYQQRALAIRKSQTAESLAIADSLTNLGNIAVEMGDLDLAVTYHREALELLNKIAPGSLKVASSLSNVGELLSDQDNLIEAQRILERALVISESLAPGSLWEARILRNLGEVHRKASRLEQASEFYGRSIDALEQQIKKLGSSEHVKGKYRAQRGQMYRDAIELELDLGRTTTAFYIQERSRAQSFLALLAERDLVFGADVPSQLDSDRRRLGVLYDRTLQKLSVLSPEEDRQAVDELRRELIILRHEHDQIVAKIRRKSPRLGTLRYPKPLDFQEVQELLDPGSALLSYSVGRDRTHLFVVTREDPLTVYSLGVGEKALRQNVSGFLELILRAKPGLRGQVLLADMQTEGRWLYKTLIAPASETIAKSDRVLIIPDGPLYRLPFGALVREIKLTGPERDVEYFAEWKSFHLVLSATVYAQLKGQRWEDTAVDHAEFALIAFGDPVYSVSPLASTIPEELPDVGVRSAINRGLLDWRHLPSSRDEILRIAAHFPAEKVKVFLGEEATEERAKFRSGDSSILHFATHGYMDERFPLNSALVLTIPQKLGKGRENGLLQAWEIFEQMRIEAELVVLSACSSALGQEQWGEGLIGLTRAFQYAGARTVVASLWAVDDRVTAELMDLFYGYLRRGASKAEALRLAQLELLRQPGVVDEKGDQANIDASAPYYWAGFQVFGDWF